MEVLEGLEVWRFCCWVRASTCLEARGLGRFGVVCFLMLFCQSSAMALKPRGCAAQAAAGSSVQSHLGSGLACTLPSPGTCGLLILSCSEQRICDCYLSQSATICSFSALFCQAFRQQPLRVSMPHLRVVHVFAPVELILNMLRCMAIVRTIDLA